MEDKNLEQVKELIEEIADYYDLPTEEQVEEIRRLTGIEWTAEDLQTSCCEYWSHNSLEETAYLMFHEEYPPVREVELVFWKYKPGIIMDDKTVYEKYRFGKGELTVLEALPIEEILQKIKDTFHGWEQNTRASREGRSYRFDCMEQAEYWMDIHFWIFLYGRETEIQRENQLVRFFCHNMSEQQINSIVVCMENFGYPLHIKEERNI